MPASTLVAYQIKALLAVFDSSILFKLLRYIRKPYSPSNLTLGDMP